MSDCGEEVSAGERLFHQERAAMGRRELLAPIAADEGEGNAARFERIGNAGDRLAGKMGVEQSAVDHLAFERVERVSDGAGRPNHGDACLLQHSGNVEGYEELVFNNEDALCCHPCSRLSAEAKTRIMFGGEVDLNWAVRSSPFPHRGWRPRNPLYRYAFIFRPKQKPIEKIQSANR
jgi:hypothetical protein